MESESKCLEPESMMWIQSQSGGRVYAVEPDSNSWSQSLYCGARVCMEEPDSSCFSPAPDFSVSSGPVGTNSDFFDSQENRPFLTFLTL